MFERCDLIYWPFLQGRGEYVRLVLEDAGIPYRDVARLSSAEGGGVAVVRAYKDGEAGDWPAFAPPILVTDEVCLAQMSNICMFVSQRAKTLPAGDAAFFRANQLMLTIADLVAEAHDTHHPIDVGLHYEEQKDAAVIRARAFVDARMPRFLNYFERVLERVDTGYAIGADACCVDLSLFQSLCGLEYAFPRAYAVHTARTPRLLALRSRIAERPRIAAYLGSERRLPLNEFGIFRRYPELDFAPGA